MAFAHFSLKVATSSHVQSTLDYHLSRIPQALRAHCYIYRSFVSFARGTRSTKISKTINRPQENYGYCIF